MTAPLDLSPAGREVVLAFADDEHLIGARHTAWIGRGPFLEEDLAFCSIAQDEIGHAIALYELLVDHADDVDRLALLRDPADYRSCWLVELPCVEWADALARHLLYDNAEELRWEAVATSSCDDLAAVALRARREEAFHVAHARGLVARLLDSGGEGRAALVAAIERLAPTALALWEPVAGERAAIDEGVIASSSAELAERWWAETASLLATHGLVIDRPLPVGGQQARTVRSEHFADLHAEIRRVIDLDPNARW
jgi:ring-1,2-phenylacetyl-CoA epoxidase subunit PaaC